MADEQALVEDFRVKYAAKLAIVEAGVERFASLVLPRNFAATIDPYFYNGLVAFNQLLSGPGKRGRGVLAVAGYELARALCSDDSPYEKILIGDLAGILEAVQAMLLVIDDMADNDDRRRGLPTIHAQLAKIIRSKSDLSSAEQARNYAALSSSTVNNIIYPALLRLPVSPERTRDAAIILGDTLVQTARGQGWDMQQLQPGERITIEQTLRIAEDKTARYTIENPWKLGALFGGMPLDGLDVITPYATKAGQAFQIRDDIIGTFGDSQVTGKSNDGDFHERKRTMLVALAHEQASEQDLRTLDAALDNPTSGLADYQDVLRRSGALEAAESMVAHLTEEAIASLPLEWPASHVAFLRGIALNNAHRPK